MAYIDEFGCEYSDDKKEFVRCPKNYKGHYTIQEGGVTSIGEDAFEKCDALQTIFVPLGQKARFAAMGLPAAKIVESTE